jgi:hypothetical protein
MKFQNVMRMQMIMVGLAAALFFTATVRAQEITNTEFNSAPNAVPFVQPAALQPSNSSNAGLTGSQTVQAVGFIAASASVQQASMVPAKSARVWVASTLLLCIGLVVFCARTTKNDDLDPRKSIRARSMPLV